MIDSSNPLATVLRELSRSVRTLTSVRRGRLVRLVVSVPEELRDLPFAEEARAFLHRDGMDAFDVEAVPGDGPVRIVVAEFER
ncbi:MAG: hypothetical protein R3E10_07205 [Gemmatimonadota bacterium]